MKKFLGLLVMLLFISTTSVSAIRLAPNSDEILDEMHSNQSNFIRYGGMSTGVTLFIAKSSLNVEFYSPPNYIISAREVVYFNSGRIDRTEEGILKESTIRYKYDIANKKMYIETIDENKNLYWKYLDPTTRKNYKDDNPIAAGEYLFYLAYKISFYGQPVTPSAKKFINEGR